MATKGTSQTKKSGKTHALPKGAMAAAELDKAKTLTEEEIAQKDAQAVADAHANATLVNDAMSNMVATLSTPIATAPKPTLVVPPEIKAAYEAELKELQAKFNIPTAPVKATKSDKVVHNEITRPGAETTCGKIWATADRISKEAKTIATIAMLKASPDMLSVNEATLKTQYARWRKFNDIKGRLPTLAAPVVHQPVGEYEGMQPVA